MLVSLMLVFIVYVDAYDACFRGLLCFVFGNRHTYRAELPDCMDKLAKRLTMLFAFLRICLLFSLFFLTAL